MFFCNLSLYQNKRVTVIELRKENGQNVISYSQLRKSKISHVKKFQTIAIYLCPVYTTERRTLLSTLENIDNNLLDLCEPVLIRTLLFVSNSLDTDANTDVLNATIEYIVSTKRLDEPLFQ